MPHTLLFPRPGAALRAGAGRLALLAALAVTACGGEGGSGCDPTAPSCGNGTSVASVEVSSPIDSVIAVGQRVQMNAVATDQGGATLPVSFTWTSSPSSVAGIDDTGVLSAATPGSAQVRASAAGVTGSLTMVVVDADLGAASALLHDPFFTAMLDGLGSESRAALDAALSLCTSSLEAGNIVAARACLADGLATSATDGTETALLGVLALYLEQAARHLGL